MVKTTEIDEIQRMAKVIYEYDDHTLLYMIYLNDMNSSYSEKVEDKQTDFFTVETSRQTLEVYEYHIKDTNEYRYVTNFDYKEIHYRLKGIMDKEDFIRILENLYYY